jgi:hypothetical protein
MLVEDVVLSQRHVDNPIHGENMVNLITGITSLVSERVLLLWDMLLRRGYLVLAQILHNNLAGSD